MLALPTFLVRFCTYLAIGIYSLGELAGRE
jgi:hypothetical protein